MNDPYFFISGFGKIFTVASVITPKIPSEPRIICCKSGPPDIRGTYARKNHCKTIMQMIFSTNHNETIGIY